MEVVVVKDRQELERLEDIIQKNIGAFYEVGRALMVIRHKELYKIKNGSEYQTFEAYCRGVWDFQRAHAYRLMDSVKVVDNVSESETKKPVNLEQTRPLAKLEPEQQRIAWTKAVETAPEGKVTAAHVSKVVKEMTGQQTPPKLKKQPEPPMPQKPEYAAYFVSLAISQLERIPDNDPAIEDEFNRLQEWMANKLKKGMK